MTRQPERPEFPWVPVEGAKGLQQLAEGRPARLLLLEEGVEQAQLPAAEETVHLPRTLFRTLSQVESPAGLIAFFEKPRFAWADLPEWLLLLDRLQDPGNLGTLLRTAAATGFGLVSTPGTVSFFNPKVIRASASALFATPFLQHVSTREPSEQGYRIYAARSGAPVTLFELPLKPPCCFAVGNEGGGLDPALLACAEEQFEIPMASGVESLNVAVAGALIMYEIVRRSP